MQDQVESDEFNMMSVRKHAEKKAYGESKKSPLIAKGAHPLGRRAWLSSSVLVALSTIEGRG